jgi:hypothetical protein
MFWIKLRLWLVFLLLVLFWLPLGAAETQGAGLFLNHDGKPHFGQVFVADSRLNLEGAWQTANQAAQKNKETASFKDMVQMLRRALLNKDLQFLEAHVDLEGIVKEKVRRFSSTVQGEPQFTAKIAGKIISLSDFLLAQMACSHIRKEYAKTSPALCQRYYRALVIHRVVENKNETGTVTASFLGSPATLSAVFKDGRWIVVGVESPVIDKEFKLLIKAVEEKAAKLKQENPLLNKLKGLKKRIGL